MSERAHADRAVRARCAKRSITGSRSFRTIRQRSAVIGALHAVQHENDGYLTPPLMDAVAAYLNLPPIQVYEVASFYSMFETKPVGRHSISICTNISCMLRGSR